jgi:hypothetical protein
VKARPTPTATWLGLAVALVGTPLIALVFRGLAPGGTSGAQRFGHELALLGLVGLLLWIVTRAEKLPLASIGLRFDQLGRSFGWGLGLAAVALLLRIGFVVGPMGGIAQLATQISHLGLKPAAAVASFALSELVGVGASALSQEVCYRGYPIERLEKVTGSRWLAGLLSFVVFCLSHFHPSVIGVLQPVVLGGLLTVFYVKRGDLVANLIGNFLPLFLLNVFFSAIVLQAPLH